MHNLFIVGTDTGVGKTVLSLALMHYMYARNHKPCYLKLVQTGCRNPYDTDSDARFIYRYIDELKGRDCADAVISCFREPKAPYFAARSEGAEIDPDFLIREISRRGQGYSPLVIEGAGGLMVPLTEKVMMIDLVAKSGAKPVIAARAGLGTINHTLLTVEALKNRGIESQGIVFVDPLERPTESRMVEDNRMIIEKIAGVPVAGVIPRIVNFRRSMEHLFPMFDRLFIR
ncbi:MAG: dethiobiotin synthase [Deltaproteobacteria bacterium]|nr:dethiobiotin synthase [Deltaproteobacteria bacterium]